MPRFYFDTENDEKLGVDEVFDLRDIEAARLEAIRYLAGAAREHLHVASHPLVCTVKDEEKKSLLRLRLVLEVD